MDEQWYQELVDDCKGIVTEGVATSRWALIETYHQLGTRILQENDNFERHKIYGKSIAKRIAFETGQNQRTVERAIKFAKKFPGLDKLPEGKNISWSKIYKKYLPEPKEEIPTRESQSSPVLEEGQVVEAELETQSHEDITYLDVQKILKRLVTFDPASKLLMIDIRREGSRWKVVIEGDKPIPTKQIRRPSCPNKEEGHQGCIDFIDSLAKSRGIKFPNYPKQIGALHRILKAGFTWEQINKQIDKMEEDSFWSQRGFDIVNIANELGKGGQ